MYCIDASVFINAEVEGEEFHEYSAKLMQNIREHGITIIVQESPFGAKLTFEKSL
ncbi:hypothetical protein [Candidatus Methanoperedens nitratireducens]|uniref:Uncharacterized protein n=1 Tax=Candidatus Methanoperedens nitratireducens TaxID=1392998 RepID=A0A284VNY9_9EURY|nr:hypothetical protein [Candidatus Methanoperedens nitroreducens]SNQ60962.1 hypothetical protein MNV_2130001 [Candidatus Methanoperedens nitroreducens]